MADTKIYLDNQSVTIIGGAYYSKEDLDECLTYGPVLISADGAANNLDEGRYKPDYIIGDFDSLKNPSGWKRKGSKLLKLQEQDTTDFEKCLYSVDAATFYCIGFIGRRSDHFLAVCSSLVKYHFRNVILVGSHDIIFHIPRSLEINLPLNTRISLFPMKPIAGLNDVGLRWPISGINFDPIKQVGTSNSSTKKKVKISLSDQGMLIILPRSCLPNAIETFKKNG